jgi:hypothetical protein
VPFRLRHALQVRKHFALMIEAHADKFFKITRKIVCVVHAHVIGYLQVKIYVDGIAR